jgi:hypothetical protein
VGHPPSPTSRKSRDVGHPASHPSAQNAEEWGTPQFVLLKVAKLDGWATRRELGAPGTSGTEGELWLVLRQLPHPDVDEDGSPSTVLVCRLPPFRTERGRMGHPSVLCYLKLQSGMGGWDHPVGRAVWG